MLINFAFSTIANTNPGTFEMNHMYIVNFNRRIKIVINLIDFIDKYKELKVQYTRTYVQYFKECFVQFEMYSQSQILYDILITFQILLQNIFH